MSNIDPTGLYRLLRHRGKTYNLYEENPAVRGRKNPISHLSWIKNPELPYLHVVRPCRPTATSSSLDVLNSLGTTASFSSLSKARVHYILARPCQLIAVYIMFYILAIPCVLSLILTIAIYAMPPPPPRAIEGVRGIHPSTTIILSERDIVLFGYLLYLGPS